MEKIRALMKRKYSDEEIEATIEALETQVEAAALLEKIKAELKKPPVRLVVVDGKVVGSIDPPRPRGRPRWTRAFEDYWREEGGRS